METQTSFVMFMVAMIISACHAYHIVYLDYYGGHLKLIELPADLYALTVDNPNKLDLSTASDITPNGLQCGNPDVSPDGTRIVFGAITVATDSWDIYIGDLNLIDKRIDNLELIIDSTLREEDPRFSYDGNSFVYKAGISWETPILYDIVKYDITTETSTTVVECPDNCNNVCESGCNHCELWGPAYHPCGDKISYTARVCENHVDYDEVYVYDMTTQQKTRVTTNTMPDMYSHWKRDGTLLFSRKTPDNSEDLYLYDPETSAEGPTVPYLDASGSDDDAYAFKQDNNLFLFIGLADSIEGYELFLARNGVAIQMTAGTDMLGPVVFDSTIAVTIPDYCSADNPTTTKDTTATTQTDPDTTAPATTTTSDDADMYWIVYLDSYGGNLKLIQLPDLTLADPGLLDLSTASDITPNGLQCGNPDVSPDGTRIVFGAITVATDSWDIYIGDLNVIDKRIDNLELIIDSTLREEDPRFSYDGNSFVYKAGISWETPVLYDIVKYDITTDTSTTVVECPDDCDNACGESGCNHCELWGPAYHPCGDKISYTARVCENHVDYDEVYIYDMTTQQKTRVTENTMPDMYSHWKRDGTLLFSRKTPDNSEDLYLYNPNYIGDAALYLSVSASDDDAYAFKQDNNLFLFIGLADSIEGYELFIARDGVAIQMTEGTRMLGPVVFSTNIAVTVPDYCTEDNPTTTNEGTTSNTIASTQRDVTTTVEDVTTTAAEATTTEGVATTAVETTTTTKIGGTPSKYEGNLYWTVYFNSFFVFCFCVYQCT